MLSKISLGALIVTTLILAAAAPLAAALPVDACALLTPAQVGAAVGTTVGAGTYVTPEFKKTCTWERSDGTPLVTLLIQGAQAFEGGKIFDAKAPITPVSGVGDDAYYLAVGPTVSLIVKKSGAGFKVTLYGTQYSMAQKQAIEKTLALQVASSF